MNRHDENENEEGGKLYEKFQLAAFTNDMRLIVIQK